MRKLMFNKRGVSNVLAYVFSFTIATIVMISAVLITTGIIDNKVTSVASLQAQSVANKIADAIAEAIANRQSTPELNYSKTIDVPRDLADRDYYAEVSGTTVYVNTTDGRVSKSCPTYSTELLNIGATSGRIYCAGSGKIKISYEAPDYVCKLDFGKGNSTHHSPVESSYYMITEESTEDNHESEWLKGSDDRYYYRSIINVSNPSLEDLMNIPVKISLNPRNFDYSYANVSRFGSSYTFSDIILCETDHIVTAEIDTSPNEWHISWKYIENPTDIEVTISSLSDNYTADFIDPSTIMLNEQVPIKSSTLDIANDELVVSFNAQKAVLSLGDHLPKGVYTIAISGRLKDNISFRGLDVITIPDRIVYVATTGSDTTGDGTVGNPYKTIQRGIDEATPGDTVFVRNGMYYAAPNGIKIQGSGKRNINLIGESMKGTVINGTGVNDYIVQVNNTDHVCIASFTVRDGTDVTHHGDGIELVNYCNNVTISDCYSTKNFDGIYLKTGACYNTIINCNSSGNLGYYDDGYKSGSGIAIRKDAGYHNKIINCTISDHSNPGSAGIKIQGKYTTVQDCDIFNNPSGSGIDITNVDIGSINGYNKIENCNIHNNYNGIYIEKADRNTISNCSIHNNRYYNDDPLYRRYADGIILDKSDYNTIENCEIYKNQDDGIQLGTMLGQMEGFNPDHNIISNCKIYENTCSIFFGGAQFNFVKNCSINNSKVGCFVWLADNNTIEYCDIFNCEEYGIESGNLSWHNNIENCFIHDNGLDGIYLAYRAALDWWIKNCKIYRNGDTGIDIKGYESIWHTITNCDIYDNNDSGIMIGNSQIINFMFITGGPYRMINNLIDNCNFWSNKHGIRMYGSEIPGGPLGDWLWQSIASYNVVQNCNFYYNREFGVDLQHGDPANYSGGTLGHRLFKNNFMGNSINANDTGDDIFFWAPLVWYVPSYWWDYYNPGIVNEYNNIPSGGPWRQNHDPEHVINVTFTKSCGNWWDDYDGSGTYIIPNQPERCIPTWGELPGWVKVEVLAAYYLLWGWDYPQYPPPMVAPDHVDLHPRPAGIQNKWNNREPDIVYVDDDRPAGSGAGGSSWYDKYHVHTIQEGINNVIENGTVYVYNGTYDGFIVNKSVKIIGENIDGVIVDGQNPPNSPVINVTTSGGVITRLTIKDGNTGIRYSSSETCFLEGTKILMADGSYKNIENIKIGDLVKSYNKENKFVTSKVTNVFQHSPEEMTDYYLIINNQLRVTPNHKFYSNQRWVTANDLKIGDSLLSPSDNVIIYSLEKVFEKCPTYDLEVDVYHNYFVKMNSIDILVHNAVNEPGEEFGLGLGGDEFNINIEGSSSTPGVQYPINQETFYIINCNIYNNSDYGIFIPTYHNINPNCIIEKCNIYKNEIGVKINYPGRYNQIINCNIHDNTYGVSIIGTSSNKCMSNTIQDCKIYNNDEGVYIEHGKKNIINNSEIYDNDEDGIELVQSGGSATENNTISKCTIRNNNRGIYLYSFSINNKITDCNITNNVNGGVNITSNSNNNKIYNNYFEDNTPQAWDECSNSWDNGYPPGGTAGNRWDDYDDMFDSPPAYDYYRGETTPQTTQGSDGIADRPYNISGKNPPNKDNYPFGGSKSTELRPYYMENWNTNGESNLIFETSVSKNSNKYLYMYYGYNGPLSTDPGGMHNHTIGEAAIFSDDFNIVSASTWSFSDSIASQDPQYYDFGGNLIRNNSEYIITKGDIIPNLEDPPEGAAPSSIVSEAMYQVDVKMKINFNSSGKGQGNIILLNDGSGSYNVSANMIPSSSKLELYKYNQSTNQNSLLSSAFIPYSDDWLLVRAYIYLTKTCNKNESVWRSKNTYITTYVYNYTDLAYNGNVSASDGWYQGSSSGDPSGDNAVGSPYQKGKIGLGCGLISSVPDSNITVDWIRVMKLPVKQPTVNIGPRESIKYEWTTRPASSNIPGSDPYNPGPLLCDFNYESSRAPQNYVSPNFTVRDLEPGKYTITVTIGHPTAYCSGMNITFNTAPTTTLQLPGFNPGEYKTGWATIEWSGGDLKLTFNKNGEGLYTPDLEIIGNWLVNAITIERGEEKGIKLSPG